MKNKEKSLKEIAEQIHDKAIDDYWDSVWQMMYEEDLTDSEYDECIEYVGYYLSNN